MIGIYEIWIGDNYYHGSSIDVKGRCAKHLQRLKSKNHKNKHMQNAYNKHGTFEWQVLVECEAHALSAWEQAYIDASYGLPKYMNANPKADRPPSRKGITHSAETRRILSEKSTKALTGKKLSDTHKDNCSKAQKGNCNAGKAVIVVFADGTKKRYPSKTAGAIDSPVSTNTFRAWLDGKSTTYTKHGISEVRYENS